MLVIAYPSDQCFEIIDLFEELTFGSDVTSNQFNHVIGPFEFIFDLFAMNYEILLPNYFSCLTLKVLFFRVFVSKQQISLVSM